MSEDFVLEDHIYECVKSSLKPFFDNVKNLSLTKKISYQETPIAINLFGVFTYLAIMDNLIENGIDTARIHDNNKKIFDDFVKMNLQLKEPIH